jgi:predicted ATPase
VYRLDPLAVPPDDVTVPEAMAYGAIALLCQRAAAADRWFRLEPAQLPGAIDLCRQLDGLPLAIEMAAARVATMGLDGVRRQLGARLRLLSGPRESLARHQTLRAAFDWSYDLLTPREQAVFRRLEPFSGGFTVEFAQQVVVAEAGRHDDEGECDAAGLDEWTALDALDALIDKSLVHRTPAPASRDRLYLFESARDYARQRLEEAGEIERVRDRHVHVYADWYEAARADLATMTDREWRERHVPERHNLAAALARACRLGAADDLALVAAGLALTDSILCRPAEVLQAGVPMERLQQARPAARAAACLELAWAHYADGSRELGTALARQAHEEYVGLADGTGAYRALGQLCRLYESRPGWQGAAEAAWHALQQLDASSVPLRTRLFCQIQAGLRYRAGERVRTLEQLERMAHGGGFEASAGVARVLLTDEWLMTGDHEAVVAAASRFAPALEPFPRLLAVLLQNVVLALVRLGRAEEALVPASASLRALPSGAHVLVASFALAAALDGRFEDAALLDGTATRARLLRDEEADPAEARAIADTQRLVAVALAAPRLDELRGLGAALSPLEALNLAVLPQPESPGAATGPRAAGPAGRAPSRGAP